MVTRILAFLLTSICCFGQAYTLRDQAFLGALISGSQGVQSCGSFTYGLTSYFKLDESGTGQWCKDSATGNEIAASFTGSTWPVRVSNAPTIIGRNPYSVAFPSPYGWVNCGSDSKWLFVNNNYSISIWVSRTNTVPRNYETIIQASSGTLYFSFHILERSGQYKYLYQDVVLREVPGPGEMVGPTVASVGLGNWNMWTITKVGSTWTMYKDAVPVSTATAAGTYNPPGGGFLTIGNNPNYIGDRYWGGYIAEARLYTNYGMSSNDVSCLYRTFYGR